MTDPATTVRIRWLAAAKDAAGMELQTIAFLPGETAGGLRTRLQAAAASDRLRWLLGVCRLARTNAAGDNATGQDAEFCLDDDLLAPGDEVLVLPPFSGGAPRVELVERQIAPGAVEGALATAGAGGIATFVGVVRGTNHGRTVRWLEYSAFAPLAVKEMEAIAAEAQARWSLIDVRIVHRLGHLEVGDVAVALGVASPHRKEAFEACAWVIDELKRRVPIWKREVTADGAEWIGSTP